MIMSSETRLPASITFLASIPSGVPALIAARSISPVEIWGMPYFSQMNFACVPLPAPGAPNKISFIVLHPWRKSINTTEKNIGIACLVQCSFYGLKRTFNWLNGQTISCLAKPFLHPHRILRRIDARHRQMVGNQHTDPETV